MGWGGECDVFRWVQGVGDTGRAAGASAGARRQADRHAARTAARAARRGGEHGCRHANRIEAAGRSLQPPGPGAALGLADHAARLNESRPEPGEFTPTRSCSCAWHGRKAGASDVGLHRHWLDPPSRSPPRWSLRPGCCWSPPPPARRRRATPILKPPRHRLRRRTRVLAGDPGDRQAETSTTPARPPLVVRRVFGGGLRQLRGIRALFIAAGGSMISPCARLRDRRVTVEEKAQAVRCSPAPRRCRWATPRWWTCSAPRSCLLLGTDAMSDGVEHASSHAVSLVVFEKVPWPRPDILHGSSASSCWRGDPNSSAPTAAQAAPGVGPAAWPPPTAACSCCSTADALAAAVAFRPASRSPSAWPRRCGGAAFLVGPAPA